MDDDFILFDDKPDDTTQTAPPWKLMIVDDEPEVHDITQMTLQRFSFDNRQIEFIHAYSAQQARELLPQHCDVALILLDVVMETDDAGLTLVEHIRNQLNNHCVRIVLRTGQPGQAPEDKVVEDYDINDYKDKTELTSQKLRTLIRASLRSYRDICALETHKRGLEKVVESSKGIFELSALHTFVEGALDQLSAIMHLDDGCIYALEKQAYAHHSSHFQLLAHQGDEGPHQLNQILPLSQLPSQQAALFDQAINQKGNIYKDNAVVIYCQNKARDLFFYIVRNTPINESDQHFIKLLSDNITIALENIRLNEVIVEHQRETMYRIGEIVETRSKESGKHVKRVALYTAKLAELAGLDEKTIERLKMASPLHDVGKVATPDAILHKPAKLDDREWSIMRSHAEQGEMMLADSSIPSLLLASEIAGSHHERWDGKGYPRGLKGEEIPISGRLTALADVFDALGSSRCYKLQWDDEEIVEYISEQSGKQFDPHLSSLLLNNLDQFYSIREQYQDEISASSPE